MAKDTSTSSLSHEKIETSNFLMIVLILLVLSLYAGSQAPPPVGRVWLGPAT